MTSGSSTRGVLRRLFRSSAAAAHRRSRPGPILRARSSLACRWFLQAALVAAQALVDALGGAVEGDIGDRRPRRRSAREMPRLAWTEISALTEMRARGRTRHAPRWPCRNSVRRCRSIAACRVLAQSIADVEMLARDGDLHGPLDRFTRHRFDTGQPLSAGPTLSRCIKRAADDAKIF